MTLEREIRLTNDDEDGVRCGNCGKILGDDVVYDEDLLFCSEDCFKKYYQRTAH